MNARMIDHETATKDLMAERYLLGELTGEELDSYEEHLFSCQACFEQVKTGTELVSHLGQIGPDATDAVPGFVSRFFTSVMQPAAITALTLFAVTLGIAIHQSSIIAKLKGPKPESRSTLVGIAHGGSDVNLVKATKGVELSLNLEYASKPEFVSYQVEILSGSGKTLYSVALLENQAGTMASINMPVESLEPGQQYSMVVFGLKSDGTREEAGRSTFKLQFQES